MVVLRIRDVYPGSRIPDTGSNNSTKRGGGKFLFVLPFFCCHKYHIVNNFIFGQVKKIFLSKTLRIVVLFTQKFIIEIYKIRVGDTRCGNKPIPDPGTRFNKAGSRIRIRNTG
jgi:hypothetical protein